MFTVTYRGWFIHGHFGRSECYYGKADEHGLGLGVQKARTFLGAKRAITKAIKEGK